MIQSGDISAESLNWISESIGVSNEEILSKGQKLRIESSQRTFFRIPFKDKSSILMVVPEGIDESIESFYTKAEIFKKANQTKAYFLILKKLQKIIYTYLKDSF